MMPLGVLALISTNTVVVPVQGARIAPATATARRLHQESLPQRFYAGL